MSRFIQQFSYFSIVLFFSCAAQGPASGGPADKNGPELISIEPANVMAEAATTQWNLYSEEAENAVIILNAFIYRTYKFHRDNKPRKITGLFTTEFKGSKNPIPEHKELCTTFKAFIFSLRSNDPSCALVSNTVLFNGVWV